VLFDGEPIAEDLTSAKRRVGYLPESNPLYDEMLVSEYLDYVAELRELGGREMRSGLQDAVDETGIHDVFYRPIGELSKGYRQRIGMAAAILHRPEVLILDEPTEGLDPNQRVEIRRLVGDLGRERTVLLSTHVMQEVEATCSRLLILRRGRLVARGSVEDLLASGSGAARYVVEVEGEGATAALAGLDGVSSHHTEAVDGRTRVHLETGGDRELRPVIFELARERGWTLWELHRERVSLEQVFRDLTGDASEESELVGVGAAADDGSSAGEEVVR
jgi:ABC-2 type transport system ATP-binding protein